jgi:hypothetical protein
MIAKRCNRITKNYCKADRSAAEIFDRPNGADNPPENIGSYARSCRSIRLTIGNYTISDSAPLNALSSVSAYIRHIEHPVHQPLKLSLERRECFNQSCFNQSFNPNGSAKPIGLTTKAPLAILTRPDPASEGYPAAPRGQPSPIGSVIFPSSNRLP